VPFALADSVGGGAGAGGGGGGPQEGEAHALIMNTYVYFRSQLKSLV
jgi:hypothetical protein